MLVTDSGVWLSAGADALTLAYWYQAMLAQQHPMAWMHALYGQGQQGSLNMHPAAQIPPLLAPGQVPPPSHTLHAEQTYRE